MPLTPARARAHANLRHFFSLFLRQFSSQLLSHKSGRTLPTTMSATLSQHPLQGTNNVTQHPLGGQQVAMVPAPEPAATSSVAMDPTRPTLQPLPTVATAAQVLQAAHKPRRRNLTDEERKVCNTWITTTWHPYQAKELNYNKGKAEGVTNTKPPQRPKALETPLIVLGYHWEKSMKGIQPFWTKQLKNDTKRLDGKTFELYSPDKAMAILASNRVQQVRTENANDLRSAKQQQKDQATAQRAAAHTAADNMHKDRMDAATKAVEEAKRTLEKLEEAKRRVAQSSMATRKRQRQDAQEVFANTLKSALLVKDTMAANKTRLLDAIEEANNADLSIVAHEVARIKKARKELSEKTVHSADEN